MENHTIKTDFGYVLKNSKEQYFIGYNQISDQLRKAKIYHSKRYAPRRLPGVVCDFKKVKIEIKEIEEIEE